MADILNYTWSQFKAFLEATTRQNKSRDADMFSMLLIATRGSEESVKRMQYLFER
ncbi:hypothetical protein [Undibacterium sp.]|uniref:hypothetical protein n=1 Tax=Undibacterium sp. TaxID=1914977 RepID=UPI002731694E|nr:hypothetical protein [Undibacterium sp.]MDP1980473.1 hypothetical protein [Undibacterium sp.]